MFDNFDIDKTRKKCILQKKLFWDVSKTYYHIIFKDKLLFYKLNNKDTKFSFAIYK